MISPFDELLNLLSFLGEVPAAAAAGARASRPSRTRDSQSFAPLCFVQPLQLHTQAPIQRRAPAAVLVADDSLPLPPPDVAPAPAAAPAPVAAAPAKLEMSEAPPFLPKPAHLDGTYVGDVGFDPLNIAGMYNIKYMREAELKHGRICMLATVGYIAVDCGFYAPGAPHVSSLEAHDVTVKSGHMLLLLLTIGLVESLSYVGIYEMLSGETDREPGDLGFAQPGWNANLLFRGQNAGMTDRSLALAEIKHCRLAMMGFSGIVTASALTEGSAGFP